MPGTPGLAPEAASYARSIALLADLEAELRHWLIPRGLSHLDHCLHRLVGRNADLWEYENLLVVLAWRFCGPNRSRACRAVAAHCYAKARQTPHPPLMRKPKTGPTRCPGAPAP